MVSAVAYGGTRGSREGRLTRRVAGSSRRLATILGRRVRGVAHPFGSRGDHTADTVGLVREAGFTCACANESGAVRRGIDPFRLPRAVVRNRDGAELASRLEGWFGG